MLKREYPGIYHAVTNKAVLALRASGYLLYLPAHLAFWLQERLEIMNIWKKRVHVFFQYKDLWAQLVVRDIKLKYRRSVLGYVWSILNPLLIMIVLTLCFLPCSAGISPIIRSI